MAITSTPASTEIQIWRRNYFREYIRGNLFSPYIGTGMDAVIQRIYELRQEGGEQITLPILGRLTGAGQTGANPLVGNEESLDQYGFKIIADWARHAVLLNKKQMNKSAIDQLGAVRPALMDWSNAKLRDDIVNSLFNIGSPGGATVVTGNVNGILYGNATAAQKNTWGDNNSDRIIYGQTTANYVAGNHASSLANVGTASGTATAANMLLLKRRAKKATTHIRPLRVEEGREYFVAFMGSNTFRDFGNDAAVISANTNARAREGGGMNKNPLFQDGDLLWKGIIAREVPEIDNFCKIAGAGASGADVYPVFMTGQNALGLAYGQMPQPTERTEDDYGMLKGRGIEMMYGIGKVQKGVSGSTTNLVDWGVATGFFASASD